MDRAAHKLAKSLGGFVKSQAARIERIIAFGGGVAQEFFQTRPWFWIIETLFPSVILLAGQKEAREIRDLGQLFVGESAADIDDFLSDRSHMCFHSERERRIQVGERF